MRTRWRADPAKRTQLRGSRRDRRGTRRRESRRSNSTERTQFSGVFRDSRTTCTDFKFCRGTVPGRAGCAKRTQTPARQSLRNEPSCDAPRSCETNPVATRDARTPTGKADRHDDKIHHKFGDGKKICHVDRVPARRRNRPPGARRRLRNEPSWGARGPGGSAGRTRRDARRSAAAGRLPAPASCGTMGRA
jgi:hypothetical protein